MVSMEATRAVDVREIEASASGHPPRDEIGIGVKRERVASIRAGPFPLRRLTASIAKYRAKKSYFEVNDHDELVRVKDPASRDM